MKSINQFFKRMLKTKNLSVIALLLNFITLFFLAYSIFLQAKATTIEEFRLKKEINTYFDILFDEIEQIEFDVSELEKAIDNNPDSITTTNIPYKKMIKRLRESSADLQDYLFQIKDVAKTTSSKLTETDRQIIGFRFDISVSKVFVKKKEAIITLGNTLDLINEEDNETIKEIKELISYIKSIDNDILKVRKQLTSVGIKNRTFQNIYNIN